MYRNVIITIQHQGVISMARPFEYNEETANKVITMYHSNFSYREIASQLKLSLSKVQRIIKRFGKNGN